MSRLEVLLSALYVMVADYDWRGNSSKGRSQAARKAHGGLCGSPPP